MDVFDLYAKLSLDSSGYDRALNDASEHGSAFATKLIIGFKEVGSALSTVASKIYDFTKSAVESYADYEQLIGGIETIFKSSSDAVIENAEKAYQTAGISANEYMETVTSFSAALIQSTGRGAQQDLEELKKNLDEQYKETKRSWEDRIALIDNADAKTSMRRKMEDELEALKEHNKDLLKQAEEANMASVTTEESLARAAELADMAIIDMSDNANKMGTSMESLQNAYNGFARNQYNMLDNLHIGYQGTKAEMERLLRDAEKLSGIKFDISNYGDVVQAIHIIQVEMGIAGTTAEEAQNTISGSIKMFKSAWEDMYTSIAGGGKSINEAISAVVESAENVIENVFPVVEEALYGIGDLIQQIVPIIADRIPEMISVLLPQFVDALISIVYSLVDALPQIMDVLVSVLPTVIENILAVTYTLLDLLMEDILPLLLELAVNILLMLADSLIENLPSLVPSLVDMIKYMVETIVMNLPAIIEAGLEIIMALATALVDNEEQLFLALSELIVGGAMTIVYHLPEFLELGVKIVLKLVEGILMAIPNFLTAIGELLGIVDSADKDVSKRANNMESVVKKASISVSDFSKEAERSTAISAKTVAENTEKSKQLVTDALNGLEQNFLRAEQISRRYFFELNSQIENAIMMLTNLGAISVTPRIDPSSVVSACNIIIDICTKTIAILMKFESEAKESRKTAQESAKLSAKAAEEAARSAASAIASAAEAVSAAARAASAAAAAAASAASAAASASRYGGGHASGGWMQAGTTYLVGELGPELVTPTRSGYVHTAEETANMLGGIGDIYITIQGDVYDDERSMRNKLKDAIINVIEEQVSYG